MRLAIVMPVWNELYVTKQTVESLFEATTEDFQLILVDDGSTDSTDEYAKHLQNKYARDCFKYVRHPENRGVSAAWNSGLAATDSPYVAIVNNDILFAPGWDRPLIEALERDPRLAVVSPFSTGDRMPNDWPAGANRNVNPAHYMGYLPILGAAFMCRTALFDEIGMFPEEMRVYFSDQWLVLASQARGLECGYCQSSYIHHLFRRTTRNLNDEPFQWAHDEAAYEKIAKEIGIRMKPYVQQVNA